MIHRAQQCSELTSVGQFGDAASPVLSQPAAVPHAASINSQTSMDPPRLRSPQPIFALTEAASSSSFRATSSSSAAGAAATDTASAHSADSFLPFRFRTALGPGLRLDDGTPRAQLELIDSNTDDQARIRYRIVLRADPKFGSETAAQLAELAYHLALYCPLRHLAWIAPVLLSEGVGPHWFVFQFLPPFRPRVMFHSARRDVLLQSPFMMWCEWMLRRGSEMLGRRDPSMSRLVCRDCYVVAEEPTIRCKSPNCSFSHNPIHVNAVIRVACYGSDPAALPPVNGFGSQLVSAIVESAAAVAAPSAAPSAVDALRLSSAQPIAAEAPAASSEFSPQLALPSPSSVVAAAPDAASDGSFLPFRFRTALGPGLRLDDGVPRTHLETIASDTDDQARIRYRVALRAYSSFGSETAAELAALVHHLSRHFSVSNLAWIAPVRLSEGFGPLLFVLQFRPPFHPSLRFSAAQHDALLPGQLISWCEWMLRKGAVALYLHDRASPRICNQCYFLADETNIRCKSSNCRYSHRSAHVNAAIRVACYDVAPAAALALAADEQDRIGAHAQGEGNRGSTLSSTPRPHSRSPRPSHRRSLSRDRRDRSDRDSRSWSRERDERQRDRSRHSDRDGRTSERSSSPHRWSREQHSRRSDSRHNSRSRSRERDRTGARSRSPVAAAASSFSSTAASVQASAHSQLSLAALDGVLRFTDAVSQAWSLDVGLFPIDAATSNLSILHRRIVFRHLAWGGQGETDGSPEQLEQALPGCLQKLCNSMLLVQSEVEFICWILTPDPDSPRRAPRLLVQLRSDVDQRASLARASTLNSTLDSSIHALSWIRCEIDSLNRYCTRGGEIPAICSHIAEGCTRGCARSHQRQDLQALIHQRASTLDSSGELASSALIGASSTQAASSSVAGPHSDFSLTAAAASAAPSSSAIHLPKSSQPNESQPRATSSIPFVFEFFPELTDAFVPHSGSLTTLTSDQVHTSDWNVLCRRFVWRRFLVPVAERRGETSDQLIRSLQAHFEKLRVQTPRPIAAADVEWCASERDTNASASAFVLQVRSVEVAQGLRQTRLAGFRESHIDDLYQLNRLAGNRHLCLFYFYKRAGCNPKKQCTLSHDPAVRKLLMHGRLKSAGRRVPSSPSVAASTAPAASGLFIPPVSVPPVNSGQLDPAPLSVVSVASAAPSAMIDATPSAAASVAPPPEPSEMKDVAEPTPLCSGLHER